jgi:dCMP deaminase
MSPCVNCAKVIINSGIKEVVFLDKYRDTTGIELLERAGVKVSYMGPTYQFI